MSSVQELELDQLEPVAGGFWGGGPPKPGFLSLLKALSEPPLVPSPGPRIPAPPSRISAF